MRASQSMIARRMTCKHFFPAIPFKRLTRITISNTFRIRKRDPTPRIQDDAIRVIQAYVEEKMALVVKGTENDIMLDQRGKMTAIDIIKHYISSSGAPVFLPATNAFEPYMSKMRAKRVEELKALGVVDRREDNDD
jgi:histone H3/H4